MTSPKYRTLSEELIEGADRFEAFFKTRGYRVRIESTDLAFPYTPTFLCFRKPTTLLLEIDSQVQLPELQAWATYAMSCQRDTRVALGLTSGTVSTYDETTMRDAGIGLYALSGAGIHEKIPPTDLALNIKLPTLESLPGKLRELLGEAYDQFQRSNWREGFQEACQVLEVEARAYLWRGFKRGRIVVLTAKDNPVKLTARQVRKMPLGPLAASFLRIQTQNHADDVIGKVLTQLNEDRVGATHHKKLAKTERHLRENVAQHMFRIINALREIHGIKSK